MRNIIFIFLFFAFNGYSQNNSIKDTLTLEYYYNLGMPIINKIWNKYDKEEAISVLTKLKKENIKLLPRNNGKYSSALFSKLTEIDTSYSKLDFNFMFPMALADYGYTNQLLQIYSITNLVIGKFEYSYEMSKVFQNVVNMTEFLIVVAVKFIDDNPELDENRKKGLLKMKNGLNTIISALLSLITEEYKYYNKEDLLSLSSVFFIFYKNIYYFLDESAKNEFDKTIKKIANSHPIKEIQELAKNK